MNHPFKSLCVSCEISRENENGEVLKMNQLSGRGDAAEMVRSVGTSIVELLALCEDMSQAQWERSPVPQLSPVTDADGRRASGGVADPTADVACDERRADLRAAVAGVAALMRRIQSEIDHATTNVHRATRAWQGPTTTPEDTSDGPQHTHEHHAA